MILGGLIRRVNSPDNVDLTALDDRGNLEHQLPYQNVYGAVIRDWFGVKGGEFDSAVRLPMSKKI